MPSTLNFKSRPNPICFTAVLCSKDRTLMHRASWIGDDLVLSPGQLSRFDFFLNLPLTSASASSLSSSHSSSVSSSTFFRFFGILTVCDLVTLFVAANKTGLTHVT
ncbi:hypothetical protein Hanom_Chr11g01013011 [Helianthus anomalus]